MSHFNGKVLNEKAYLRIRGQQVSGLKPDLVRRCELHRDTLKVDNSPSAFEVQLDLQREVFKSSELKWSDVTSVIGTDSAIQIVTMCFL